MGMYDEVKFKCPSCSKVLEFQTKSGHCNLDTFPSYRVPVEVAAGLIGESISCFKCGKDYKMIPSVEHINFSLHCAEELRDEDDEW